ncbi:MAG: 7-cyano-7-deazaguanine synthase, partial [Prochlorococcus sp.]
GGDHACGICDSCRIRDAALSEAGRSDLCSKPTP